MASTPTENLTTVMDPTTTTTIAQRDQAGHSQNPFLFPHNAWKCANKKHPWAFPGYATELGEGCGIHGGNPLGCPFYGEATDNREPGSVCLPDPNQHRGTWSYGSRAIDIDFPQVRTTQWSPGSVVPVGFVAIYHGGGYN